MAEENTAISMAIMDLMKCYASTFKNILKLAKERCIKLTRMQVAEFLKEGVKNGTISVNQDRYIIEQNRDQAKKRKPEGKSEPNPKRIKVSKVPEKRSAPNLARQNVCKKQDKKREPNKKTRKNCKKQDKKKPSPKRKVYKKLDKKTSKAKNEKVCKKSLKPKKRTSATCKKSSQPKHTSRRALKCDGSDSALVQLWPESPVRDWPRPNLMNIMTYNKKNEEDQKY